MSRELLFRMAVTWPPGSNRRALIDARLDAHLALWAERLSRWFVPGRPEAVWLSDQVLQVRAAAVSLWVVLTDGEVSVFWEAPPAIRLLVSARRRETMIRAFQADLSVAAAGP